MQTRGAKRADGQNQAVKRTALGQVTNLRQQPARAAKVSIALLMLRCCSLVTLIYLRS